MTVPANDRRKVYDGDGVTTVFNGPMAYSATHITAALVEIATGVVSSAGSFTVTQLGKSAGTRVTMAVAPPALYRLVLLRTLPYSQNVDITNQGSFNASVLEQGMDLLDMQIQQLADESGRSPRLGDADIDGSGRYDGNGNRLGNIADAVEGSDAVPLQQISALISIPTGPFIQSGTGAVGRTVQDRERDTLHAADFGVVGDNVTDNTTKLADLIAQAEARGGATDILLPPGVVRFTSGLVIDSPDISLVGAGGYTSHDGGSGGFPGTLLYYVGGAGADMITFTSPAGVSQQKNHGGGLSNLWLDGNGAAARGIVVTSYNGARFTDLYVQSVTSAGVGLGVIAGSLAEAKDVQRNVFERVYVTATAACHGFHLYGDSAANASFNTFINCGARHINGHGWFLENSDNNTFITCSALRGGGGTGSTVFLSGANAGNGPARSNHFIHLSGNGGVLSKGTASFTQPAVANTISFYDQDNGSPIPVIEAGSQLSWSTDLGVRSGESHLQTVLAASVAAALAERANIGTSTVRIHNGSENHARLTDGTSEWSVSVTTGGNLRILRVSGTGYIDLGAGVSDVALNGNIGFFGALPGAKPTITGSRGGNAALASLLTGLAARGLLTDSTTA